jgi:hypothetical protein
MLILFGKEVLSWCAKIITNVFVRYTFDSRDFGYMLPAKLNTKVYDIVWPLNASLKRTKNRTVYRAY